MNRRGWVAVPVIVIAALLSGWLGLVFTWSGTPQTLLPGPTAGDPPAPQPATTARGEPAIGAPAGSSVAPAADRPGGDAPAGLTADDVEQVEDFLVDHPLDALPTMPASEIARFQRTTGRFAAVVGCPVALPDGFRGHLSGGDVFPLGDETVVVDGRIEVAVPSERGAWSIRFEGYSSTTFAWSGAVDGAGGACVVGRLVPDETNISGTVRDPRGEPIAHAVVDGCGSPTTTDDSGAFTVDPVGLQCGLRVTIRPNLTGSVISTDTPVTVVRGQSTVVDVTFEPLMANSIDPTGSAPPKTWFFDRPGALECVMDMTDVERSPPGHRVVSVNDTPVERYDRHQLALDLVDRYSKIALSDASEPCPWD